jgi:hypothetical protein
VKRQRYPEGGEPKALDAAFASTTKKTTRCLKYL